MAKKVGLTLTKTQSLGQIDYIGVIKPTLWTKTPMTKEKTKHKYRLLVI